MTRHEALQSQTAHRQLPALPAERRERVGSALAEPGDDPHRPRPKADVERSKGPGRSYHRQRIGDLRAMYVVEGWKVLVAKILPRGMAYEWLE